MNSGLHSVRLVLSAACGGSSGDAPGRRLRAVAALALALAAALPAAPALAAPRLGVDCGCSLTGGYVDPAAPSEATPPNGLTGLSPDKLFRVVVATGQGVSPTVTVFSVASGKQLLSTPADDWGFGTQDSQFVVLPPPGLGQPSLLLYHLTDTAAALVRRIDLPPPGGAVSFSPKGNHVIWYQLSPLGTNATVTVLDPVTGAQRFSGTFTYTQPIGSPTAGTKATARLGFSPDAGEGTFAYWYLSGTDQVTTGFVNLLAGGSPAPATRVGSNFVLGFSPCGDTLGFVETIPDPLSAGLTQSETSIYSSASGLPLTTRSTFPIAEKVTLVTMATAHVAQKDAGFVPPFATLAPNTAGATCPSPGPAITARFDLPATALALLPVVFSDTTVVPAGATITSWQWSFGDGGTDLRQDPSHTFAAPGVYTVTLTVTDQAGRRSSASHALTITSNLPPVADFTVTPAAPVRRDLVTFTDTSTDDDGVVSRYWIINGEVFTDPVVTLKGCGPSLSVDLTVTDGAGQSATRSDVIPLADPVPPDILVPAGGDLTAAIASACPGDRLQLEAGTYQGGVRLVDVSLRGAGPGLSFVEGFGPSPDAWVLSLYASSGSTVTVSELTVRGGGQADRGGGVGAAADTGGLVVLERLEVKEATSHGGIWIDSVSGELRVSEAFLHHNANTLDYGVGGGIGMFCCAVVTVDRSELAFNQATGRAAQGAAAGLMESDGLTFTRNDVHDNTATSKGGGIAMNTNHPRVVTVALNHFHGNATTEAGGGTVSLSGISVFAGNLVAGNPGGGVVETGGLSRLTVVNSTIADNAGTGLLTPLDVNGQLGATVWNTILTGNGVNVAAPVALGGSNIVGGNAGFVGAGDYHLAAGSPALDAGDAAAVPAALTVDLDGEERVMAAITGGAARVDIGADERPTGTPGGGGGGGGGGGAATGGSSGGCGQGGIDGLGLACLAVVGMLRGLGRRRRGA